MGPAREREIRALLARLDRQGYLRGEDASAVWTAAADLAAAIDRERGRHALAAAALVAEVRRARRLAPVQLALA